MNNVKQLLHDIKSLSCQELQLCPTAHTKLTSSWPSSCCVSQSVSFVQFSINAALRKSREPSLQCLSQCSSFQSITCFPFQLPAPPSQHITPSPPSTAYAHCCSKSSQQMPCRPVLRCGPSCELHAAGSHALQPSHQLLQAAVCGEHWHRFFHHVCPHWPGHQCDSLSSGDKEEAFLELWQRGFHCAAFCFCKQCQVRHGTTWLSRAWPGQPYQAAHHGTATACVSAPVLQ